MEKYKISNECKKECNNFPKETEKKVLRSITLTDCIGKILEKIINNRLVDGTERNKVMDGETGAQWKSIYSILLQVH